jgi:hypothetical protein
MASGSCSTPTGERLREDGGRARTDRGIRTLLEGAGVRVGRHRRRVSEGMTGVRECPRDPTSMRRPRRAPCPLVVDEALPASPSGAINNAWRVFLQE